MPIFRVLGPGLLLSCLLTAGPLFPTDESLFGFDPPSGGPSTAGQDGPTSFLWPVPDPSLDLFPLPDPFPALHGYRVTGSGPAEPGDGFPSEPPGVPTSGIPEPETWLLCAAGAGTLAALRWRARCREAPAALSCNCAHRIPSAGGRVGAARRGPDGA